MKNPRVLSFSANTKTGKTGRFTVGTDIIDYMESSRTFGREDLSDPKAAGRFQRRMIAIPDKKWKIVTPMVLTISNQNGLYLVRKDDESKSGDGWKLIELSQAFKSIVGSSIRVRAHAAAWTDDDRITIAVAVDDGSSERSRVFVAYDLSSCTSNWDNIAWTDYGTREDVRVEGIRVLDGGDKTWTVVLAGDRGSNHTFYLLRSNAEQKSFDRALIFNPGVDLKQILDFEVAVHPTLGSGIAVLGIHDETRDLSFRHFPKYKDDGSSFASDSSVEPLPCPAGANVLETGLTKQIKKGQGRRSTTYMGSDIYVGGQGVHLIKSSDVLQVVVNGGKIPLTIVASPEAAPNVQDLIVGEAPDGSVSVWSLLENGNLNTIKKAAATDVWGKPLCLRVDVQAIAPVHGDEHLTTSLLMVYANGQASFLARDASQGIWQERPLTVANPEEVTKVTCYGTTLRVLSEGSLPQPGINVKVTASVLSSVVLNGKAVFISPTLPLTTKTDANGSISLFDRVRSLTPAIYRFEVDGFNECIDVNPGSGMHERFQSMSADELRSATISTPSGEEPLLPESFRTGADRNQVDAIAGGLNNLTKLANSTDGVVAGVSLVSPGAEFSSTLKAQSLPDNYKWGIQADSKGVRSLLEEDINKLIKSGSVGEFFKNLGDTIVDFFEGVGHVIKEGVTFILHKVADSKVFQFICKIGNTVKNFVVDSVGQIGSAMTWLWNQVKTGIEKVWEYLKFVFDWQDILRVQKLMADATDVALTQFEKSVDEIKGTISSTFDQTISKVNQWKTLENSPSKTDESLGSASTISQIKSKSVSQEKNDQATGNSVISWILEKFQDLSNEIIEIPDFKVNDDMSIVTKFMEGIVTDTSDELSKSFEHLKDIVKNVFGESVPKLDDFSLDKIKALIANVGAEVLETILKIIKKIILKLLDFVKDIIEFVRKLLRANIRFPFIEKLVNLVTAGSYKFGTSFRLIDGLTLLCAIPTTIVYKIIFGEAPVKSGEAIRIPYDQAIMVQSNSHTFEIISSLFSGWANVMYGGYQWAVEALEDKSPSKALKGVGLTLVTMGFALEILGRREEVAVYDWAMIGLSGTVLAVYAVDTIMFFHNPTSYTSGSGKVISEFRECAVFVSSTVHIVLGLIAYLNLPEKKTSDTANCVAGRLGSVSEALGVVAASVPKSQPQAKLVVTGLSMATCFASQISTIVEAGTLSNPT